MQQKELIQLKREARLKGGFYVNPEAKMLFIIRIRGYASLFAIYIFMFNFIVILRKCEDVEVCFIFLTLSYLMFSINAMDPKSKKILQLLRLRQVSSKSSICVVLDAQMQFCLLNSSTCFLSTFNFIPFGFLL